MASALYNTFFYAECIHAAIHVFHYFLTYAFQFVSEDFEPMHQLAKFYASNIQVKYGEVDALLIRDAPVLDLLGTNYKFNMENYNAGLTGANGFGSTEEVRPILAGLVNMWGQSQSASGWLDVMMNISPKDMEKVGILTEFSKHTDLICAICEESCKRFSRYQRIQD